MEQHIEPLMKMLTSLMQRAQMLTNSDIWPRRPLNFDKLSTSSKSGTADHSKGKQQAHYRDEISEDRGEIKDKMSHSIEGMKKEKPKNKICYLPVIHFMKMKIRNRYWCHLTDNSCYTIDR